MNHFFPQLDLLFSSTPLEGPEQMALDEVLLRKVSHPLLRLYCWKAPCVTFGYFQHVKNVQAAFPGRTLVRRWSGGGSVEHGYDITFSLIIPASEPVGRMRPSLFYQQFHQVIVETLREFQLDARLIKAHEVHTGEVCFVAPSLHDVVIGNQKIVGGAQRRSAGSLLHQGSLNCGRRWKEVLLESHSMMEKGLFSSLASRLSSVVNVIEEKQVWLEESFSVAAEKYRTREWIQKQ